jgi:hypothetical protein
MKQGSFVNLIFIAGTILLLAACSTAITEEIPTISTPEATHATPIPSTSTLEAAQAPPIPTSSTPEATKAAPILSAALDRDCEFKVPTGKKLKGGDLAVEFTLRDVYGNAYTLSEMLQEKPVVLIFGSYT